MSKRGGTRWTAQRDWPTIVAAEAVLARRGRGPAEPVEAVDERLEVDGDTRMKVRATRAIGVVTVLFFAVAAGCGDDSESASNTSPPTSIGPANAASSSVPVSTSESSAATGVPPGPTATDVHSASSGRILFQRAPGGEVVGEVETDVYVVDAGGNERDVELLFPGGQAGRWSPDGSEVSVFCCDDGMAAHIVDTVTGDVRGLEPPDPTLETFCGAWSPDGERLVCEGYGVDDPSRNGIYSILASDGGGLTRITSNPGGSDIPGDYSPDGTQLVFKRFEDDVPTGMYVVDIAEDGIGHGEPQRLTPEGMVLDDTGHAGRWSPDGEMILFVAQESHRHHKAIWIVSVGADGGAPRQLPIAPGCGGPLGEADAYGCYWPGWSPDGDKIVFTRSEPDGSNESIWIANADGSDLVQVTDGADDGPAWGIPPSAG